MISFVFFPVLGQAPRITAQPEGGFMPPGQTWTLSAMLDGSGPIAISWYKEGKLIEGAMARFLMLTNTNSWFKDEVLGKYHYVASNTFGAVTSSFVEIKDRVIWRRENGGNGHGYSVMRIGVPTSWTAASVLAAKFGGHLASVRDSAENKFIFDLVNYKKYWSGDLGNGSGPWLGGFRSNGAKSPSEGWCWVTGEKFLFQSWELGEPNNGSGVQDKLSFYSISTGATPTWDDNFDTAAIKYAVVEWPDKLSVTGYPNRVFLGGSNSFELKIQANSSNLISYQWFRLGVAIDGATNSYLKLKTISLDDDLSYYCVVSDGVSVFEGSRIRVLAPPVLISSDITNRFARVGDSLEFVVDSSGRAPSRYQWFRNSNPIVAETNKNIRFPAIAESDSGHYWVQVSNRDGFTNSSAVLVKVLPAFYNVVFHDDFSTPGNRFEIPWRPIQKKNGLRPVSYLGDATLQEVTVNLTNLAPHSHVHLQVDVLVLRSADGTDASGKGDVFRITSEGGEIDYQTSFSNHPWSRSQTYPGRIGDPLLNARAGSIEQNTLGVVTRVGNSGERPQDTLYRVVLDFPHTGADLKLTFSGQGWSAVADEAWGLDNLVIATATLVEGNPPVVTRAPEPQVVRVGDAAAFQVSAASVGAIDYQWFLDGTPIPDATNSWYAIPAVYPGWNVPETPGNYSVRVSNAYGSVTRPPVPLIVVTEHPESITGVVGRDLELRGRTTRPVQYQWMRDGVVLPGETNASLTLRNPSAAEAGKYGLIFGLGGSSVSGGGFEVTGPARVDFNAPGQPGEPLWRHRSTPQPVNNVGGYLNPVTPLPGGGFLASAFALNTEEFSSSGARVSERFSSAVGFAVRSVVIDDLGRRICLGFTGGAMSTNILQVYSPANELLWEVRFPGAANNSPAVQADGRIVVGATPYSGAEPTAVYCFSPEGALLWSLPTGRVVGQPSIGVDGMIYFGEESTVPKQSKVYAVRPDGTVAWTMSQGAPIYASPTLTAEGEILIADVDGVVTCYRPDGTKRWSYKADSGIRFGSPVLDVEGNIYFATSLATLYSLAPDGTVRWFVEGTLGMSGSLAVSQGGSVYGIDGDGRVVAVGTDGRPRWSAWLPRMNQYWWEGDSPAILSDGTVVAGSLPYLGGGVLQGFRGDGPPAQSVWPEGRQDSGRNGRARIRVKSQPGSVSVGAVVEWTAETSESGVQFQWLKNGSEIAGATAATFRVGPVQSTDSGRYQVRVTTPRGAILGPVNEIAVDGKFERMGLPWNFSPAVAWGDLNDDGFSDLLMGRPALWDPVANQWTVPETTLPFESYALGDLDGDGRPEAIGVDYGRSVLEVWRSSSATEPWRLLSSLTFGQTTGRPYLVVPSDADLDGRLDVLLTTVTTDREVGARPIPLLFGDGAGGFGKTNWLDVGNGLYGAAWGDADGDLLPDLVLARHHEAPPYGTASLRLRNLGQGQLDGTQTLASGNASEVAWADYDNDGDLDVFLTYANGAANRLYRNLGAGVMSVLPVSSSVLSTDGGDSIGATWGDYDNDGLLDLFVANRIGSVCFLYRQESAGVFRRVTAGSMTSEPGNNHGAAWADFDNDGWLDLAVARAQDSGSVVYRNRGGAAAWLRVRLRGVTSNRQGLGAKIRAESVIRGTNGWQMREVSSGGGFGHPAAEAHFGLADADQVSRLRMEWPSGQVQERMAVPVRQILTVTESTLALPRSTVVQWGADTTLSPSGEPPTGAAFEWWRDGVPIPGATGRTLVLSQVTPDQAGRYQLRAVGSSETVITAPMVLTVEGPEPLASRKLPASYWPGVPMVVSLRLAPGAGVAAQAFEDRPPQGWTVTLASDGGLWDPLRGLVKFGPYFDDQARDLSYTVVPGEGLAPVAVFGGTAAADDLTTPVIGQREIPLGPVHPADRNPFDGRIVIGEMTSYASAWRRGSVWPSAPQEIPISYVTRAGYLWRHGESYWHDLREGTAPVWWKAATDPKPAPRTVGPAGATETGIAERRVPLDWMFPNPLLVTVRVDPAVGAGSVALEERIPSGWRAEEPNEGGNVDDSGSWVRWGPFFDANPRTLQYRLVPTPGAETGGVFEGVFSVDGVDAPIGGVARIPQGPKGPPTLRFGGISGAGPLGLQIAGDLGSELALEVSTDLRSWSTVQRVVGQGMDRPVAVELPEEPAIRVRFWRVRGP
jgi:hypothetical protein